MVEQNNRHSASSSARRSNASNGDRSGTGNPFFDAWLAGSEQVMQAQADWFSTASEVVESAGATAVVDKAKQHWDQCEQQFNNWVSASEQWFSVLNADGANSSAVNSDGEKNAYFEGVERLKKMLDPATFLSSGVGELNQMFQRMVEGPDFADIGVFEKKFMRTSKDWLAWRDASANYQSVIAAAWAQAFELYTQDIAKLNIELAADSQGKQLNTKQLIKRWLRIANEQLVTIQRSDEFLDAQRKLFKASTQYKLKQREIVEAWCENYNIPTRTEIDDLHRMVYALRREVRELKQQVKQSPLVQPSIPTSTVNHKAGAEKVATKKVVAKKVVAKKKTTQKASVVNVDAAKNAKKVVKNTQSKAAKPAVKKAFEKPTIVPVKTAKPSKEGEQT